MTCSHCLDAQDFFDERRARKELSRYRRKGPAASTRLLLDGVLREDVSGRSLMDIGGGVGTIQHELAGRGVRRIVGVDASPGYVKTLEAEAARRGYADCIESHVGDFLDLAPELAEADIVTLDRVVCCYPDMVSLVRASAAKSRALLGLVFPRPRWIVRLAIVLINLRNRLARSDFRTFVHSPEAIERTARESGLEPCYEARTFLWSVVLFAQA
ncbi:MAG: class I SAM-dependent methyltransferase [Gemmatimonadota bacterium]